MRRKALLAAGFLLATMLFVSGCASKKTPYDINDQEKYNVSVKYDANGGLFTDNTTVIVDSYSISDLSVNDQGQVEIALLPPDDSGRGTDAFKATKNGYFLGGWYTERTEVQDEVGNVSYTYQGKWDFNNDLLKLDASGDYTASQPELTLYAAWVPLFNINLFDLSTGDSLGSITYDPTLADEISVPAWDENTGTLKMNGFPELDGYTLDAVFYDKEGTQPVTTATIVHPGKFDAESGTASDIAMNLYVDYIEGEWYRIYNADQFIKNATLNGNYVLYGDLDFTGKNWPTSFMHGNFTGSIEGNGYSITNVDLIQQNNEKMNAGLFGSVASEASISNLGFDNISFTIKGGVRKPGASLGLFAGVIAKDAFLSGLTITNSTLKIDSKAHFGVDDYSIGLVCGMGDHTVIDQSGIDCTAVGTAPETVIIAVDGNTVTVEISK